MKENNSTAENSRPNQHSRHTHSHTKSRKRRRRSSSSGRPSGHVIFVIVFSIILVVTIVRLFLWNRGRQSDYNPNETTTEFDVEVMDYLQPLDPEMLEGHEDDGVTTVLALGNDLLSDDRSDTGLAALMEKSANATILNAAFPGSSISMKHQEFDNSYPLDGVSLYWVAAALLNQNFDLMDVIVPQMNSEAAVQALETLKSVDLSKVDDLVILYDLQDYRDDRTVYDEANDKNLTTVYGALTATIKLFQEQCPHIRIYLLSQPYGTFTDANGSVCKIVLDIYSLSKNTVWHELSHAIDRRLAWDATYRDEALFTEEGWSALNPDGFTYTGEYGSLGTNIQPEWYSYFIDDYSMINAAEDRARIFEYAVENSGTLFRDAPGLIAKLQYYSDCIRDCFDTALWPEITAWEAPLH